jgi:glycosyltransferase involved in cell wall biosynthesis
MPGLSNLIKETIDIMEKLSVLIITFNEEAIIKKCLDSVIDLADEIIVVDSFSNDKTEALCREFHKVTFFQRTFDGYGNQKNWAIEKSSHSLLLSIDADEVVSEELKLSIIDIKRNCRHDAYTFNRKTNYCGAWITHGGWYPDVKLRLWKRGKGLWNTNLIHENIVINEGVTVKHLSGDLLHYSYESIHGHIAQLNRFTDLNARLACEKGKSVSVVEIIARPIWKFVLDYIIKKGFLDGYFGFIVAVISSFATFLKYAKLQELIKKNG